MQHTHEPAPLSVVKKLNNEFTFDWNDYRTHKENAEKISVLDRFVEDFLPAIDVLEPSDKYAFGQLCLKLGTYYNHIKRNPQLALAKLNIAKQILNGDELAWTQNHIAFSFQQWTFHYKVAASKSEGDAKQTAEHSAKEYAENARENCNNLIQQYNLIEEIEAIKITAFAFCVKALTEYEDGKLDVAVSDYRFALTLYEVHNLHDDQYARAKNRYAQFLVAQNNLLEATNAFVELQAYWSQMPDPSNPYPARFYVSYADFLEKNFPDNVALIAEKYDRAYKILLATEGEESLFTKDIAKKASIFKDKLRADLPPNVISNAGTLLQFKPAAKTDDDSPKQAASPGMNNTK